METTKRLHGFGNVGAKLFDDKSVLRLARTEGSTSMEKAGLLSIEGSSGHDQVEW